MLNKNLPLVDCPLLSDEDLDTGDCLDASGIGSTMNSANPLSTSALATLTWQRKKVKTNYDSKNL